MPTVSLNSVPAFPFNTITDNPVILEDNSIIADEYGASAKATSVEPQIKTAHTLSSHTKEEPEALDYVDALTALEPLNPPASPDGASPQNLCGQAVGEVGH